MTISLTEKPESRAYGSDGSVTLVYNYRGAGADTVLAFATLLASLPTTFEGKTREPNPQMETVDVDTKEGTGNYIATCRYLPVEKQRQTAGEVTVRIGTAGGSRRITQAYAHITDYPAGAPNHKGAIGVTKDGAEGCDVADPVVSMTVLRRYTPDTLPATAAMMALRGRVNSDSVTIKDTRKNRTWTCAAGELLCVGVEEGLKADDGLVDVTFQFEASPNQTGLTIGDITEIAKKGHEHLWCEYFDSLDGNGKKTSTPLYAHVDQVYPTAAMNGLGLNGT